MQFKIIMPRFRWKALINLNNWSLYSNGNLIKQVCNRGVSIEGRVLISVYLCIAVNSRVSTGIFKFGRRKDKKSRFPKPEGGKPLRYVFISRLRYYIYMYMYIISLRRMFGVPLEQLIVNNQLPEKLQVQYPSIHTRART